MKILLIESDSALAQELSKAIEARGVEVRVTSDGKEGVDLARVDRPDLIVLCVELPKMSGYSVCNKLKKDDQLKSIPLVIISAEATQETFEQHRKLKTRAEGYLIKPFEPAALLSTIEGLVALPAETPSVSADEVVSGEDVISTDEVISLEEEVELEPPGAQVATSSTLSTPPRGPAEDDDLTLLDEAFESLASEEAKAEDAAEAIVDPDEVAAVSSSASDSALVVDADIDKLGDETDAALAALSAEDTTEDIDLGHADALLEDVPEGGGQPPRDGEAGAALAQIIAAAGPVVAAPAHATLETAATNAELERLQARVSELVDELARAKEALDRRNSDAADASARLRKLEASVEERRTGAARAEEQTRAAKAAAERAETALRAAGEETRRLEERAKALEADAKNNLQRAEREELARKAADAAAAASAERARAAEERARTAEERARVTEENLHALEGRISSAEELAQSAETRAGTAEARTSAAEARADTAEQESASLRLQLEEAEQAAAVKSSEAEQARERAEALARELEDSQASVASHLGELEGLRPQLDGLRAELADTRSAAEGTHAELERKFTEAQKRVEELEAQNAKHEERVVKAYQKIKADEKIREKARKALAIAQQLLEDRALGAATAEAQPRRD